MERAVNHCGLCKIDFKNNSNLRRHARKYHPAQLDEIAPHKQYKKVTKCEECNKTFSKHSFLNRHFKNFHSDKINVVTKKLYNHKCMKCDQQFTYIKDLKFHQKTHRSNPNSAFKCSICECQEASRANLTDHLEKIHNVKIECQNFVFSTMAEFETWKLEMEHKDRSSFVKWRGSAISQHTIVSKYICHRSGTYNRKENYTRHLKIQGSNKINSFCPAGIKLVFTKDDGKCKVTFTKTHIGHTNDLGHLPLSGQEREKFAAKIAAKIPFPTILDGIRDSLSCELEREHLLTKKDLFNIEQRFNLHSESVRHKNDAVSLEVWVEEMKSNGSILFYKPQDIMCEESSILKKDDFILVIMTKGQMETMQKYSQDCVCLDWTHGLSAYGFELHTLLILDDLREGFPCAFLISNRADEEVMKLFFSCIRDRLQMQLRPKVFMSDMAESYYNAWIQIMFPAEFRLFCTWHVKRAWKRNLTKIDSKEKQIAVDEMLQTLLKETDVTAFSIMMHNFVQSLSEDPQTLNFANYFTLHYMNKPEAWASCHRLYSGLNSNMHLEGMHETIKYLYLKGENVKRVDKSIDAILKFVRDKNFDRVISFNKVKLCTKIKNLRKRHKAADVLHLDSVLEMETGWQISSQSSNVIYIIEEREAECDCKLLCSKCEACIHRYSCTCLDSSVKWNMCKHIHLLCRYRKSISLKNDTHEVKFQQMKAGGNLIQIDSENHDLTEEVAALVKSVSNERQAMQVDWQQQILQEQQKILQGFKEALFATKSREELDVIRRILAPLKLSGGT